MTNEILLEAAWNIAKTELRYREQGKLQDAEAAHERLQAVFARMGDPAAAMVALAERLSDIRS